MKKVKIDFIGICSSWTSSTWEEIDYDRIRDMSIRGLLDERSKAAYMAQERECVLCPDLEKHVSASNKNILKLLQTDKDVVCYVP